MQTAECPSRKELVSLRISHQHRREGEREEGEARGCGI